MKNLNLLIFCFFSTHLVFGQVAREKGELLVQFKSGCNTAELTNYVKAETGILPEFKVVKIVSEPMRTWLCSFNEDQISGEEILRVVRRAHFISAAQFNHRIESRLIPNDPFFGQQWHHANASDIDIDSDLAWDVTTGGYTATGDRIVVCVIEPSGSAWGQADLQSTHWTNAGEIPSNGFDDDSNGYVDDVNGWNITTTNDVIDAGSHGSSVSSMIGSSGNNATGVTGVNWDVGIMQVEMGGVSEASVIEAYTYPWIMRKLYQQTQGQKGAYVVATNSSWGVDGGQPSDSPLWCAMYDSLGMAGILSCGATANNNVNIDQVGDLPTSCPSEFLIAVTATNNNDVRTFSGYGIQDIDLAAPGASVYLATGTGYGAVSGTSFASPCVAGAIGLLYSAPCPSWMLIAQSNPALGAQMIRDFIFQGVDTVANLQTECATGGRLNVNNSLQLLIQSCDNSTCLAPFAVGVEQINGSTNYNVHWNALSSAAAVDLRYRLSNGNWVLVENIVGGNLPLDSLEWCSNYEVQLRSRCNPDTSQWSSLYSFQTDGCCVNPVTITMNDQNPGASLHWNHVLAANQYEVQLINTLSGDTLFFPVIADSLDVSDLGACIPFQASVISQCVSENTAPPVTFNFTTPGCSNCESNGYCSVSGSTQYEWIQTVSFATMTNDSGNDNGYGDFTNETTLLVKETPYTLTLTPGTSGTYAEYFKVWIDYNHDLIFDDVAELIYDAGTGSYGPVTGNFSIPISANNGPTRLRVAMGYVGSFGTSNPPSACNVANGGEAEDYCVTISGPVSVNEKEQSELMLYPVPTAGWIYYQMPLGFENAAISIYRMDGRLVHTQAARAQGELDLSHLADGVYTVLARNSTGKQHSRIIVKQGN